MFDFHEKRKIRNVVYSKASIGLVLLLTAVLSFSVYERFTVEGEMAEKREIKERELEELRHRSALLEAKVEHLKNDRGIEEELRSRFDVAKEGEQVVILLDESEEQKRAVQGPPGANVEQEKKSFFSMFKFW